MINKEKGITLIALVITVIVLIIIASISVYEGTKTIKEANAQTIETNMLAIKAKAKSYAEEIEAATWAYSSDKKQEERSKLYTGNINENGYGMVASSISSVEKEAKAQLNAEINQENCEVYEITENTLTKMGLKELVNDIKGDGKYLVVYDLDNFNKMDIIYTSGINYKETKYYTLSSIQSVRDNEE